MKVAVGLRRVAAGKRTSGRRAAQIAPMRFQNICIKNTRKKSTLIFRLGKKIFTQNHYFPIIIFRRIKKET